MTMKWPVSWEAFENGDMVMVHDFDGYPLGRGFINTNSKIRIRMMTRKSEQEIDEEFLRKRVRDAWEYSKKDSGYQQLPCDLR